MEIILGSMIVHERDDTFELEVPIKNELSRSRAVRIHFCSIQISL